MGDWGISTLIKRQMPKYVFALLCGLLVNMLTIFSTFLMRFFLDRILPSKDPSFLMVFSLGYLGFYVFKGVMAFFKSYLFSKHGYDLLFHIRNDMFSLIVSDFGFEVFSQEKQGYIITLFRDFINSISWFLSNVLLSTITEVILLLLASCLLVIINPKMFCVALIVLPVYGIIYFGFNAKIRDNRMNMMNRDIETMQILKESLDSVREMRAFNVETEFIKKYNFAQETFNSNALEHVKITTSYDIISSVVTTLGQLAILYCGGMQVMNGNMSVGTLVALNSVVALLYSPVEKIVNFNRLLQVFRVESGKLSEFTKNSLSHINPREKEDYSSYSSQGELHTLLELREISFDYGKLSVLKNINLTIKENQSYAIVGENGSGKTTLVHLITALIVPKSGNIFCKGLNIHESLHDYKDKMGYVAQDPVFLNDTILNNIVFGRSFEMFPELISLMKLCEIDSVLTANSMDLHTVIGEKGSKLSGGQKQRIALCRALYKQPDILVIDEGTSQIDSDSEGRILRNIQVAFPNLSIILVSHRLSTIENAQYVLVLKNGVIVENDTLKHLKNESRVFCNMFGDQLQSS